MPVANFPTSFYKFRHLRSFTLSEQYIEVDVDGHLPASLVDLTLHDIYLFDERWFIPQVFATLESLTLVRMRASELKAITRALVVRLGLLCLSMSLSALTLFSRLRQQQGRNGYHRIPLTTLSLDLFELSQAERPTVDEFLNLLSSFARVKSIRKLSILSIPDTFGGLLFTSVEIRCDVLPARAVFEVAQAVSRFANLEDLTFHLGYRHGGSGWQHRWRGFWGDELVSVSWVLSN